MSKLHFINPKLSFTLNTVSFILKLGNDEIELATKVMQFVLVTDCGFQFALAHFPVNSLTSAILR